MRKKNVITITVLIMSVILTGCANNNLPVQQNQETEAYDPADFNPEDVYVASEQTPSVDISGCDTFTQIVDKLETGKAYANVKIGDTDVLMVASGAYEWEPGKNVAIDADIFCYKDSVPTYLATVSAGGTAYPLAVKDGYLYVGGNHFMIKYLIDEGTFIKVEEAYVEYDTDGNEKYYYGTCNAVFEKYDEDTAKSNFEELFIEHGSADMIDFPPV